MGIDEREPRARNEDAVRALLVMIGGPTGMLDKGVHFSDLAKVLDGDPNDPNIKFLTSMGGRMTFSPPSYLREGQSEAEPIVYPEEAKDWLLRSGRATATEDGLKLSEDIDHLGLAALAISQGEDGRLMTAAYAEATDNRSPLSPDMVKEVAQLMVSGYMGDA